MGLSYGETWAQMPGLNLTESDGRWELQSTSQPPPNTRLEIETSPDLVQWAPLATVHSQLYPYRIPSSSPAAFFRLNQRLLVGEDDWTNQLDLDAITPWAASLPGQPAFVKFTYPLNDPASRVFFQDSSAYPFHYHFIVARLAGYQNLTFPEFERVALSIDDQELLLGSLIFPPDPSLREAAIQFVGNGVYPVDQIARWFHEIEERIVSSQDQPWRIIYIPSFEQQEATFENEAFFTAQGIQVDTASRWITSNTCYANGWAFGRLVFIPGDEIHQAYGDGRLRHDDILLTDAVPAEIPIVAGVITLSPATPNSHVALLSRSLGIPFAYASGTAIHEQLQSMDGEEILLVVSAEEGSTVCRIESTITTDRLTDNQRQAIADLKEPPAPTIQPKREAGRLVLPMDAISLEDIDRVGGKAAHFSLLKQSLPQHSPEPALALTFDLWDAYLEQPFADGTFRSTIAQRLAGFTYPPDIAELRPALSEIREWIEDEGSFSPDQQATILEALRVFPSKQKIRFRSSTNVEDSQSFSGAGLYDSFSGCTGDDLDDDTEGPSLCDGTKSSERGVFRAIRKVFASFYNENAYLERLRHGIDEQQVGMGILVHPSFPDADEMANGVATLELHQREDGNLEKRASLVTQLGAESVTNPNPDQQPEVVFSSDQPTLHQPSSLVEEGTVMEWPENYTDLIDLLQQAAEAYRVETGATSVTLDFEYKKMKNRGLVVKQIRPIPEPPDIPPPTLPF